MPLAQQPLLDSGFFTCDLIKGITTRGLQLRHYLLVGLFFTCDLIKGITTELSMPVSGTGRTYFLLVT